jgi:hypothetical protein
MSEPRAIDPAVAEKYERDGYVVLEQIAPPALREAVLHDVDRLYQRDPALRRVTDAWLFSSSVRRMALLPGVLDALEGLYGRRPIPFQTLNFKFGSEQAPHADAVHFQSMPPGYVCGVWVALEDVGDDQGPLELYPGSHMITELHPEQICTSSYFDYPAYERKATTTVREAGLQPVRFHARAGDALVWSANIVHGGSPVLGPDATRWSQVSHYFFEGCTYFTPMYSDMPTGRLFVRDPMVDISTGKRVWSTVAGKRVRLVHETTKLSRVLGPGDPRPGIGTRVASAERTFLRYGHWRAYQLKRRATRR